MAMEFAEVISIAASSVITGIISTVSTVKALNVHISYIKETQARHERAIERAHERLDEIERGDKKHE